MGQLTGVEEWEGGYASSNAELESPREWRRSAGSCGVRHLVWAVGGLVQLVGVGIQLCLLLLLAREEENLLIAVFFSVLALCQLPAGWVVDRFGPSLAIMAMLVLSASVLVMTPDYPIGLPFVLIVGSAQACLTPALSQLLANWSRFPGERDCALFCRAAGSAGACCGVSHLLTNSSLPSSALRSLGVPAGILGVVWPLVGASVPIQWGRTPLSFLLPLTVSDLHALPPPNVNEKAMKEKQEREQRQKAKLAQQQATKATAKYARKMDKRSGDAYNEYKAKADAKKAAAAAAKAEKAAAARKAAGQRNTDTDFSRSTGGRKAQQQPNGLGVVDLLRTGSGLGTLALCQLACSASILAVSPLQYQQLGLQQQSLLSRLPLAVFAGPIAAAASAWLKSSWVLGTSSMQSVRRLFGCRALQMQGGVLLAFALLTAPSGPWQQLEEQRWFQGQHMQAAAGVLQACTVAFTTVASNEIALQTIDIAVQKRVTQIGLITGVTHSISYAPAALASAVLVLSQPAAGDQRLMPLWNTGAHLREQVALVVAACLCFAGGIAFGTVIVPASNRGTVRKQ